MHSRYVGYVQEALEQMNHNAKPRDKESHDIERHVEPCITHVMLKLCQGEYGVTLYLSQIHMLYLLWHTIESIRW